jgi:acetoin utilization deacetylase AcuC-like enzyme
MRVVYSPLHLAHEIVSETVMGLPVPANEVAERAEIIRATLQADGGYEIEGPVEHGDAPILAVHDEGLLRFLSEAWIQHRAQGMAQPSLIPETIFQRGYIEGMGGDGFAPRETPAIGGRAGFYALDTSTPIVAGTYLAARASVDVALTAVDRVLAGDAVVYGLCRPPGHHAGRSTYGGYCFFNNAAIAAHAITERTGERVAILDVDYHHGNGTQQIFWRRGDVLYVSLHADPTRQYPYFLGFADEVGEGPGNGANLNLPLPAGTTNTRYLEALDSALERIADEPGSIVVVSLGLDTYGEDPICDFALTTDVYHEVGRRVKALGRKLVILQEGGYHRPALGENVRAWLRGVEGREHDPLPAKGFTAAGTRG